VHNAGSAVHPLGASSFDNVVIANGISVTQSAGIDARYRTESTVWMRSHADVQRFLSSREIVLPMMDQQKRPNLLRDLAREGLLNPIASHQNALCGLHGSDAKVVRLLEWKFHMKHACL
jgi:hypothetical protein